MKKAKRAIALAIAIALGLLTACGHGNAGRNTLAPDEGAKPFATSQEALAQLDALAKPDGVDDALWDELKSALKTALTTNNQQLTTRTASTPPTGEINRINDLAIADDGDGTYSLTWHYRNVGDYDQNGTVGISDITPLAQHFGETYNLDTESNSIQAVIDGSGNGKIGIEEITPIAQNYGKVCAAYSLRSASMYPESIENTSEIDVISLDPAQFEERRAFNMNFDAPPFTFLAVVPFDNEDKPGELSNVLMTKNHQPVAVLKADHISGDAPLTVNFNAGDSHDIDGLIAKYKWDWEGDGTYDYDSGTTPTAQHIYVDAANYQPTVRVADAYGLSGVMSVSVIVSSIGNMPPVAGLTANPTSGIHPLLVNFDAGGSTDSDGTIVKYEWDWEGDGIFEYDSGTASTAQNTYEDVGNHSAVVRVTDDGSLTDNESVTIRTNPTGGWVHTWGGNLVEYTEGVAVDESGGVYVAGSSPSFSSESRYADLFLLKYDDSGELLWQNTWDGYRNDELYALVVDNIGNVYLAGASPISDPGRWDSLLIKYSPDGSLLWQKTWGGDDIDVTSSAAVDRNGNVYLTGRTFSFGYFTYDAFVLKYDSEGNLLFQRLWGGSDIDYGNAIAVDSNGDFFLTGITHSFSSGYGDVYVVCYSPSGELLWQKIWGGYTATNEEGNAIAADTNGDVYVTGWTNSFGAGNVDVFLLKYSYSGELLWQKIWGGEQEDRAYALAVDEGGNIWISGRSTSFNAGAEEAFIIQYSSAGELLLQKAWTANNPSEARAMALSDGLVYITGYGVNTSGSWRDINGSETSAIGMDTVIDGDKGALNGLETSLAGNESIATGTEDIGGGGADSLTMKIDPQHWN